MRAGFTLIELILAIFFSTIIMSILFSSFIQINKSALLVEDLIEIDLRQQTFANQFEKDISGAFVPVQGIVQQTAEKNDVSKKIENAEKEKAGVLKQPPPKKEEAPKKVLQDTFVATRKGDQLQELTFISNNPLRPYPYAQNTQVNPNMVRIVYRLQEDAQKNGSYSLLRQEGTDLEFGAYKKGSAVKGYELIKGIKNITVEFRVPKEPLNQGQKKDTKKPEQPITFETKKEWHSNEFQKDKKQSQLPQFVLVELTLWDNQLVNDRTIKMLYTIPAFGQDLVVTKTQESKMPLPKKDEKKEPDKKEQAATGQNKIVTQRRRVFPDTSELRSTIQDYMNSIRGRAS